MVFSQFCYHLTPRVHNYRVPIASTLFIVRASLRGSYDKGLGLDGSRTQQGLPVGLACGNRERRWVGNDFGVLPP